MPPSTDAAFVLYTFSSEDGGEVCHAYVTKADGTPLTQAEAEKAAAGFAGVGVGTMVLPAEAVPASMPQ